MFFCRFPFDKTIYSVKESTDESLSVVSFIDFEGNSTKEFYGKLIHVDYNNMIDQMNSINLSEKITEHLNYETETTYKEKILLAKEFLLKHNLPKLVLSRIQPIIFKGNSSKINFLNSFENLCNNYPNAFVYLLKLENCIWMGAFSELLGRYNKKTHTFETMSLAGTTIIEKKWTSKEIYEQKAVTDFIKNILLQFSEKIIISDTFDHLSGNIKHLRTDFSIKILPEQLEDLIAKLHPTPAVCGFPKELCKIAILELENHPRELYSGYIRIERKDVIEYYVNLRCGKFYKNIAEIFIGGGINSESNPNNEWYETVEKSKAILSNLAWN